MNTETLEIQEPLTTKQKQAIAKLENYHKRYDLDPEFRQREITRSTNRVKNLYHTNEEYRFQCIERAKARYQRKKAQAA